MKAKGVAIITRTLREGKTLDDYRKAWYHTRGFGMPTRMLTVVDLNDPRRIISIGIMEIDDLGKLPAALEIDVEERIAHPMDDVVEDAVERRFGVIASEDDFSAAGAIAQRPMTVDGAEVTARDLEQAIGTAAGMFAAAARERDRRRREKSGR